MQFASTVGSGTGRPFGAVAYIPKVQVFKELEMKSKRVCQDRLQRTKLAGSQMNNLTGLIQAIAAKAQQRWVSGLMAAAFLLLLMPLHLYGQAVSRINGVVTDQAGAVVAEAKVTVTNVDTNVSQTTTTTSAGTYLIIDLVPGTYVVKVEFAGAVREPEQLEISVDGERVQLVTIAANAPPPGRVGGRRAYQAALKAREFRIPVKAGPRLMGITFINQNDMRDEETLRPQMRDRGTRLAISAPPPISSQGGAQGARHPARC